MPGDSGTWQYMLCFITHRALSAAGGVFFVFIKINRRSNRISEGRGEVEMKYAGEIVDICFPVDNPHRFYLVDNQNQQIPSLKQIKPVDLVANANPPHISTSYSTLFQNENEDEDKDDKNKKKKGGI